MMDKYFLIIFFFANSLRIIIVIETINKENEVKIPTSLG